MPTSCQHHANAIVNCILSRQAGSPYPDRTRPGQARPIGLILSPLLSGAVGRRGSVVLIDLLLPSLCAASPTLTEEGRWVDSQTNCSIRKSILDLTVVDRLAIEIQCLSSSNLPDRQTAHHPTQHPVSHIMVSMSNCIAMFTGRAGGRARAIQCNNAGRLMRLQNIGVISSPAGSAL